MEHGFANTTMCIVNAGQMADNDPTGFVKHWGSDREDQRAGALGALARALPGLDSRDALNARLAEIAATRSVTLDGLEVAAELAAEPRAGSFAATAFMPAAW